MAACRYRESDAIPFMVGFRLRMGSTSALSADHFLYTKP